MHTAEAFGYPASSASLRDPGAVDQRKIDAEPIGSASFQGIVADQPESRGVSRNGGGTSGWIVTMPTDATGRCGSRPTRNDRIIMATTRTSPVRANGLPTQIRGPASNAYSQSAAAHDRAGSAQHRSARRGPQPAMTMQHPAGRPRQGGRRYRPNATRRELARDSLR